MLNEVGMYIGGLLEWGGLRCACSSFRGGRDLCHPYTACTSYLHRNHVCLSCESFILFHHSFWLLSSAQFILCWIWKLKFCWFFLCYFTAICYTTIIYKRKLIFSQVLYYFRCKHYLLRLHLGAGSQVFCLQLQHSSFIMLSNKENKSTAWF